MDQNICSVIKVQLGSATLISSLFKICLILLVHHYCLLKSLTWFTKIDVGTLWRQVLHDEIQAFENLMLWQVLIIHFHIYTDLANSPTDFSWFLQSHMNWHMNMWTSQMWEPNRNFRPRNTRLHHIYWIHVSEMLIGPHSKLRDWKNWLLSSQWECTSCYTQHTNRDAHDIYNWN